MNHCPNKETLISEFKKFLQWESQSFENWESIEILVAETLSEAWLLARPNDINKFFNKDFKKMVDSSNGKWLEKLSENDSYKIILSTKYCSSIQSITKVLVHEMRHCLDYQNAVKHLSFEDYHPGNRYYNNWSGFRAVYSHTRYEYFSRCHDTICPKERFDIMAEILGKNVADATTGLMRNKNNLSETLYFISRYIGVSRAIRNINMEENIDAEVFHLWHMTPQYIFENFGYVFYIGNEWDKTDICELNASAKTYYYNVLVERIQAQED